MNNQAKSVKLKGVGEGLYIILDVNYPKEFIFSEIDIIFEKIKHLAFNAKVTIDIGEDKDDNNNLIEKLGKYLIEKFGVASFAAPIKKNLNLLNKEINSEITNRQEDINNSWQNYQGDVLMLTGKIRSGQQVVSKKHLVILGNVNPGAEIIAGGDILVMGSLFGTAIAGQPNNQDSIILALDFRPNQVQIGIIVAAGLKDAKKKFPEFAHIENGIIVVEEYMNNNPFGNTPWPQPR